MFDIISSFIMLLKLECDNLIHENYPGDSVAPIVITGKASNN